MSKDLKPRTCWSEILGFSTRLFNTSWPLIVTHCIIVSFQGLRLIVFAFSDNPSAENSKLSAESGRPGLVLLECMDFVWTLRKNFERELLNFLEDTPLKSLHGCTDILFRLGF